MSGDEAASGPVPLVIVGCGGQGREILCIAEAVNASLPQSRWRIVGFVDDAPSAADVTRVARRGREVLGDLSWLERADHDTRFLVGIGAGSVRRRIDAALVSLGFEAPVVVHPAATVGEDVRLRPGTVVWAGARITTNVELGRHCHVNNNATIGHDSRIGDYVTVSPLVAVSGNVAIGDEVLMGTQSSVIQGLTIGARSVVGAGACVVRDVPPDVVATGVPARWQT